MATAARALVALVALAALLSAAASASTATTAAHSSKGAAAACAKKAGAACVACAVAAARRKGAASAAVCTACAAGGPVAAALVEGRCHCPAGSALTGSKNTVAAGGGAQPERSKKNKSKSKRAPAATCSPCAVDAFAAQSAPVASSRCARCPPGTSTEGTAGATECFEPFVNNGFITTYAGDGAGAYNGDGIPATQASLGHPVSLAIDARGGGAAGAGAGGLFVGELYGHRVRRIDRASGIISTVVGTGAAGSAGDGGPAVDARIDAPFGLALDAAGGLLVADRQSNVVRRASPSAAAGGGGGTIGPVAGSGAAASSGDGGPATAAAIDFPWGVAVDGAAGASFVADFFGSRVRRIGPDGVISTYAGTGERGYAGDGGPATSALLANPSGLAFDRATGALLVSDFGLNCVRRVAADGVIARFAGTCTSFGFAGDGGPAADARLFGPTGLAVDRKGGVYIADTVNNRVRKVAPDGVIATVAGNGDDVFGGDGGKATEASLRAPSAVAVDGSGAIFVADANNNRVRKIA